ncbi:MAG: SMP-30/gluconolactonase/LRE family protein, partial [Solirubrobacteraceae bacterium]
MRKPEVLLEGVAFGESPRWHDGRLWLCDWGAQEVLAVDGDGRPQVMTRVPARLPFSIDWDAEDRLLVTAGPESLLLRQEPGGSLATHADLGHLPAAGLNEIVVDGRGNAYVNGAGFDLMAGEEPAPGMVAVVAPDGTARAVAGDLAFPNGMALTPGDRTLIVADSYAKALVAFDVQADGSLANRRTWADVEGPPDGICFDAEGAVWYGCVPDKTCVRVSEGGEVLERIELDRGCFACMLGGADGKTLFLVANDWRGPANMLDAERTGQVLTAK